MHLQLFRDMPTQHMGNVHGHKVYTLYICRVENLAPEILKSIYLLYSFRKTIRGSADKKIGVAKILDGLFALSVTRITYCEAIFRLNWPQGS